MEDIVEGNNNFWALGSSANFLEMAIDIFVQCTNVRYGSCIEPNKPVSDINHEPVHSPTHRRVIKEESKVANSDWVDHQTCSLLQNINVKANLFIMGNFF